MPSKVFTYGVPTLMIVIALLLMFGTLASDATSHEALPEADPTVIACERAYAEAEAQGLLLKWCRKVSAEATDHYRIVATVQVKILGHGRRNITQRLFLSKYASISFIVQNPTALPTPTAPAPPAPAPQPLIAPEGSNE